jgi:hypothetical protein
LVVFSLEIKRFSLYHTQQLPVTLVTALVEAGTDFVTDAVEGGTYATDSECPATTRCLADAVP